MQRHPVLRASVQLPVAFAWWYVFYELDVSGNHGDRSSSRKVDSFSAGEVEYILATCSMVRSGEILAGRTIGLRPSDRGSGGRHQTGHVFFVESYRYFFHVRQSVWAVVE